MSRHAIFKNSYAEKTSNTISFSRIQSDLTAVQTVNGGSRALNIPETFLFMDYKKYASVHHEIATQFCELNFNPLIFKLNFLEHLPIPVEKVYWKTGKQIRKIDNWIGSKDRTTLRQHAYEVSRNLESFQEKDENVLVHMQDGHAVPETLTEPRFVARPGNYLEMIHRLQDLYACFQHNNRIKEKVHTRTMEHYERNLMNPEEGDGKHPAFGAVVYILGQLNVVLKNHSLQYVVEKILEHDVFESFLVTPLNNRRLRHVKGVNPQNPKAEGKKYQRPTNALDILKFAATQHEKTCAANCERKERQAEEDAEYVDIADLYTEREFSLLPECVVFYNDESVVDRAWFRIKSLA